MTEFLAKPLGTLSAIYRFVGGLKGSSRIDLVSPIVLTHDVAPGAQGGASLFFNLTHSVSTLGDGAPIFTTVEVADFFDGTISGPTASLATLGRTPDNTDVYLMELSVQVTAIGADDLLRVMAGLRPPNNSRYISTGGQSPRWLLLRDREVLNFSLVSGGQLLVNDIATDGRPAIVLEEMAIPSRVETMFFMVEDDATGIITVTFSEVYQFVPIGLAPQMTR